MEEMYLRLLSVLRGLGSVVVGFSGGVDSTLVVRAAREALGGGVVAVTTRSAATPPGEVEEARGLARRMGVEHRVVEVDELGDSRWASNTGERCYYCKEHLVRALRGVQVERGLASMADGTNLDDVVSGDRPGLRALREAGVRSPLVEAGFTKADVRRASWALGLPTHDKPSSPCLASRISHGTLITLENLGRVARAESYLRGRFGLRVVRVRDHGGAARVEVALGEMGPLRDPAAWESVVRGLAGMGFTRVELDPLGYRAGGANLVPAAV